MSSKILLITLHKALLLNRKIAHIGTGYGSLFGSILGSKSLPSQWWEKKERKGGGAREVLVLYRKMHPYVFLIL